jgi:hypothetical protein
MKPVLRLMICAAAGWLAGAVVSRTLLETEPGRGGTDAGSFSPAKRSRDKVVRHTDDEWQEFLSKQNVKAQQGITAADWSGLTSRGGPDSIDFEGPDARLGAARALAGAAKDDFPKLLKVVLLISDARVRRQVAGVFFAAWAEHDPHTAMAALSKVPRLSNAALGGVLNTWAEKDPRGMMAWLDSPDNFGWAKMQAEATAILALTERDPVLAMELTGEFKGQRRIAARGTGFNAWYRRDSEAADRWFEAATEADQRELFKEVIGTRSERDPAAAASALIRLPGDTEERMELAGRVTRDWLKVDPAAASEWVRSLPAGLARDFAAAALAEGLALTDPEAAALWARDIRNEKMRTDLLKRIEK